MRCDEFEDHVHRLADGRRPPGDWQPLRDHARRCPRCRETLAAYEAVLDWASAAAPPPLPADFSRKVVQRATRHVRPRNAGWHRIAVAAIAASLLLAAWAGQLHRSAPPPPERAPQEPPRAAEKAEPRRIAATSRPMAADSAAVAPDTAVDSPSDLPISATQWREMLAQWSGTWRGRWEPVDPLAEGIRPIAASLSVALDELRSAFPLVAPRPSSEPADSALLLLASPLTQLA